MSNKSAKRSVVNDNTLKQVYYVTLRLILSQTVVIVGFLNEDCRFLILPALAVYSNSVTVLQSRFKLILNTFNSMFNAPNIKEGLKK